MEHNKAKIISYSKMVIEEDDNKDPKELSLLEQVAFCARVSNPENQNNHNTSERLCKYLLKNHHYSPFEMVNVCIELETTRDISRQLLRHRSFTFQEFSQRYAVSTDFITNREFRLQHPTNRQMSISIEDDHKCIKDDDELNRKIDAFYTIQKEIIELEKSCYSYCIENGIAKEQARCILSEGLTITRLYMNGTLRSWIHYLQIRCDINTTQREHYDLAMKIKTQIGDIFPLIYEIVVDNVDEKV